MKPSLDTLARYVSDLADLGARLAIEDRGVARVHKLAYRDLIGKAFTLRNLLQSRIAPGDRVMLWGPSGAAWAIAYYGCLLAGAVIVPVDANFSAAYTTRIQQHTGARLLLADAARAAALPGVAGIPFEALLELPREFKPQAVVAAAPDALLEIVYTSGATAEPKGVMITHGNVLANLRPIEQEVRKYKRWARPLLPLRFVHLIPLSHLFGQVMGLLIPPLLDSAVVYLQTQAAAGIAAAVRDTHASVVIAVPQQVELLGQWALAQLQTPPLPAAAAVARGRGRSVAARWWMWRRLHRRLGWRMWAFIVGAAALPAEQEELWHALGYAVVQGYGLTETAPAVAITHPFKIRRGSVGRKLAGMEIRIAPDGEILVRGPNVSPGYYRNPAATAETLADGWLRTGDLGELDAEGNLIYKGRKKEVIVTAEGLNVYPDDVEQALDAQPEIREAPWSPLRTRAAPRCTRSSCPARPSMPPPLPRQWAEPTSNSKRISASPGIASGRSRLCPVRPPRASYSAFVSRNGSTIAPVPPRRRARIPGATIWWNGCASPPSGSAPPPALRRIWAWARSIAWSCSLGSMPTAMPSRKPGSPRRAPSPTWNRCWPLLPSRRRPRRPAAPRALRFPVLAPMSIRAGPPAPGCAGCGRRCNRR